MDARAASPPGNRGSTVKYSTNKDIAALVRRLTRKGWQYHMGGRHGKLTSPAGQRITVPCTPSDYRAIQNFKRDLRKLPASSAAWLR